MIQLYGIDHLRCEQTAWTDWFVIPLERRLTWKIDGQSLLASKGQRRFRPCWILAQINGESEPTNEIFFTSRRGWMTFPSSSLRLFVLLAMKITLVSLAVCAEWSINEWRFCGIPFADLTKEAYHLVTINNYELPEFCSWSSLETRTVSWNQKIRPPFLDRSPFPEGRKIPWYGSMEISVRSWSASFQCILGRWYQSIEHLQRPMNFPTRFG
jgi:hypothetical protein